jgi:hypothetical protein
MFVFFFFLFSLLFPPNHSLSFLFSSLFTELISSHIDFLAQIVQPILDVSGVTYTDAREQYLNAMESMVRTKFHLELPILLNDGEIFFHTINECVIYSKHMHDVHWYRSSLLQFLANDRAALDLWIRMEKNFAFSRWREIKNEPSKRERKRTKRFFYNLSSFFTFYRCLATKL